MVASYVSNWNSGRGALAGQSGILLPFEDCADAVRTNALTLGRYASGLEFWL
jgi:hypothetical protein